MLILAVGYLEMESKAVFDSTRVAGQGLVRHTSTTWTTIDPSLHGLFRPLMHLTRYLRPHAAPLSHIPSHAATNSPPSGNCSLSNPLHLVAAKKNYNKSCLFYSYLFDKLVYTCMYNGLILLSDEDTTHWNFLSENI